MKRALLFCQELFYIVIRKKKKYIVEIVKYLDDDGKPVPIGTITQNEELVDKFETMTYSRRLAYKIAKIVNSVKYDNKFDIRIYE
jgi:hypothetical protein